MDLCMPKFEETADSAVLVSWHKQAGDTVAQGEALAEVETEKFSHPIEAPCNAVLREIRVVAGEEVEVGAVLAILEPT
ncbi:hypothetical protein VARIO8X_50330 [Burkholderiales bacterium 8X]|nr:hypothetical protein VARIO8X_50330 [Burkholderiales bacterium 8X]